jgi:hypothetical protein
LINLLHVQSLFGKKNSTDWEREKLPVYGGPGDLAAPSFRRPLSSPLHSHLAPFRHFQFFRPITVTVLRQADSRP